MKELANAYYNEMMGAEQQHEASEDTYNKVAALFKTNAGAARRLAAARVSASVRAA